VNEPGEGDQCKWHLPLELVVIFLQRTPFFVVPVHCLEVPEDAPGAVAELTFDLPSQQLLPTFLS
jgi:hypothetical protein